jgi:transaldolase
MNQNAHTSTMNRTQTLTHNGVALWLDALSRELVEDGGLAALIEEAGVSGATSNPTIFAKAICGSSRYDDQLRAAIRDGLDDPHELFLILALEDVRRAAALLRPLYDSSLGRHGFVSFECTPDVADDAAATVAQALALWKRIGLPNAMIKVPATAAGIDAIEDLTAHGVNVNVTLLFSVERYEQAIEAYLRGLERRLRAGYSLAGIHSVASFFVSRVDARADAKLPADSPLRGRLGIANARVAFGRFRKRFAGPRWDLLVHHGAEPQHPLWASTATKDPAYRDVLYLEQLALSGTILTVPEPTLEAYADHGDLRRTELFDRQAAERTVAAGEAVDLAEITAELERDGVNAFVASYDELLGCIEQRVGALRAAGDARTKVLS